MRFTLGASVPDFPLEWSAVWSHYSFFVHCIVSITICEFLIVYQDGFERCSLFFIFILVFLEFPLFEGTYE